MARLLRGQPQATAGLNRWWVLVSGIVAAGDCKHDVSPVSKATAAKTNAQWHRPRHPG